MTPLQLQCLGHIKQYLAVHGVPPTTRELAIMLGNTSSSVAHRCLVGLEERGFIRRLKNRSRAIEVVAEPHIPQVVGLPAHPLFALVKEINRRGLIVGERMFEHDREKAVTRIRIREIKWEELSNA